MKHTNLTYLWFAETFKDNNYSGDWVGKVQDLSRTSLNYWSLKGIQFKGFSTWTR